MQADESRNQNTVVAQSHSYRIVWARDNAHCTTLWGPATVRDFQRLTDVEQFWFAEGMHRAPPPERASTFGCAVVSARRAQGATLTLRKQRSPGLCRAPGSSLATSSFSGRPQRLFVFNERRPRGHLIAAEGPGRRRPATHRCVSLLHRERAASLRPFSGGAAGRRTRYEKLVDPPKC
jgi:hypothetical protein